MADNYEVHLFDWLDVEEMVRENSRPVTDAIPAPLPLWSRACRGEGGGLGFAPGWHITVGGGSGQGKSLLALHIAKAAVCAGVTTCYLSYEMSRKQLFTRFLAMTSGAAIDRLERGPDFNAATFVEAAEMWRAKKRAGLSVIERPMRTVGGMSAMMRAAVEEYGAKLLVVDYIQRIGLREYPQIHERTMQVSNAIQEAAFSLSVTTVGLSQYNRTQSYNKKDGPEIEGLAGGSAIENDSDQVVLLDHANFERMGHLAHTNVLIKKNRHGPVLGIPVTWDYRTLELFERANYGGDKKARAA